MHTLETVSPFAADSPVLGGHNPIDDRAVAYSSC